jgi:outer membrane protein assembly factor BamD
MISFTFVLMKNRILFIITFSVLFLTGCSGFNKVVKSDNYEKKFQVAGEMYDNKQYTRAIALYEQVYQRVPKTSEGELAYYRLGKAYFAEKDYSMAGYYFGSFYTRFTFSPKAEETLFLSAMCAVKNSPEFSLDQNDTDLAINDLQQFINKFPNSDLVDSCNHEMDKLRLKLEKKDFEVVKLYNKTQNFKSAIITSQTFLESYPGSVYKEEVSFILVESSYFLTKNSIEEKKKQRIEETLERYRNFVAEYPNSKHKSDVNSISDKMEKELQTFTSK